jgi:hypothetical protein
MQVLRSLWNDEAGFVISAELVLVATILVIGMIVGLTSLRNQVVQELVDVGQAIGFISQGYEYFGVSKASVANTDGSGWDDLRDFCQSTDQTSGTEPGAISVQEDPTETASFNGVPGED